MAPPVTQYPQGFQRSVQLFLPLGWGRPHTRGVSRKPLPTPPLALYRLLQTYTFRGNVHELEAMLFDAVARHQGGPLSLQSFKVAIAEGPPVPQDGIESATLISLSTLFPDRLPTLSEAQETLIAEALRRAEGNQGLAAGMLGLSRQALTKRLTRRK